MVTRGVTTVLWFLMAWAAGNAASFYFGTPAVLNPVLGAVVAAAIWFDPTKHLWNRQVDRKAVRRRLADLERVVPVTPSTAFRQEPSPTTR